MDNNYIKYNLFILNNDTLTKCITTFYLHTQREGLGAYACQMYTLVHIIGNIC